MCCPDFFFGPLGDKHNKQRLIAISYYLGALSALVLALLVHLQAFYISILSLCLVLSGIAAGYRVPLQSSVIPSIVSEGKVSQAIGVRSLVTSTSQLAGPVIASVFLSIFGVLPTITGGFMLSITAGALIIVSLKGARQTSPVRKSQLQNWLQQTFAAFTTVYKTIPEFQLSLTLLIINFSFYPFFSVLIPALVHGFYADKVWLIGALDAIFCLGMLSGSALVLKIVRNFIGRANRLNIGYVLLAASMVGTGISAH